MAKRKRERERERESPGYPQAFPLDSRKLLRVKAKNRHGADTAAAQLRGPAVVGQGSTAGGGGV